MYLIPPDSLSRLLFVMAVTVAKMTNCFAVLDPLIKTFTQVAFVIGPLSLIAMILLLKKIEKELEKLAGKEEKINSEIKNGKTKIEGIEKELKILNE